MESCGTLTRLYEDVLNRILTMLTFTEIFQLQTVCREFQGIITKESFQRTCAIASKNQGHHEQGSLSFSPIFFFLAEGSIEWMGYNNTLRIWQRLPSLGTILPSPSPTLLMKDFFITASGGLLCVNVSEDRHFERIIICNPLTRTKVELPPLKFRRHPVLLHLLVTSNYAYKVIAAGSAAMGTGELSRTTEVYDSETGEWHVTDEISGPEHGLNEFQSGAYLNGILYCLAFSKEGHQAILAYNVEEEEWLKDWKCSYPKEYLRCVDRATNPQLLRCGENVYFFWEKTGDRGPQVSHFRIAKLNNPDDFNGDDEQRWSPVVSHVRKGANGLLSFPEYACSSSSSHGPEELNDPRLCVFNTISHTAEVYDVAGKVNPMPIKISEPPPIKHDWEPFYPLNPVAFSFEPSFCVQV